jgi:hypothetical protein
VQAWHDEMQQLSARMEAEQEVQNEATETQARLALAQQPSLASELPCQISAPPTTSPLQQSSHPAAQSIANEEASVPGNVARVRLHLFEILLILFLKNLRIGKSNRKPFNCLEKKRN